MICQNLTQASQGLFNISTDFMSFFLVAIVLVVGFEMLRVSLGVARDRLLTTAPSTEAEKQRSA